MPKLDASAAAAKWAQRAGSAGQDYVDGARRTDKDPTALAVQNQARALANYTRSLTSGEWAARLRSVGKAGWLAGVEGKGVNNYTNGVQQSEAKVAQAFGALFAFEANLERQIASMPNVTDADREARALAWIRGMRAYRPS